MSFTAYATAVAGSILTAAFWNQQVRDNGVELRTGGFALAGQSAGDLLYANGPVGISRLAPADNRYILTGGNPPVMTRAIGPQSIWIPASAFRPDPVQTPPAFTDVGTNWLTAVAGWPMRHGVQDNVYATLVMPRSWNLNDLYGRIYWTTRGPSGGGVVFLLQTMCSFGDGENLAAYPSYTQGAVTDYVIGQNYLHISDSFGAFYIGNSPTLDEWIRLYVLRWGDNSSDTCPDQIMFLGLMLTYYDTVLVDN